MLKIFPIHCLFVGIEQQHMVVLASYLGILPQVPRVGEQDPIKGWKGVKKGLKTGASSVMRKMLVIGYAG